MTNEEKKLNEAIKQDGIDTQSEILEELKRRYPQYVEQSDRDKEIERMANILENAKIKALGYVGSLNQGWGMWYARELSSSGIGDKKQAVKEAFEKLKERMELNGYRSPLHNRIIDELFTQLYGAEE